jgi:hypothetical protein
MSDDAFHVHGPHDHELEHAAAHGSPDSLAGQLAVLTAIVATIGAIFSYMGGEAQAEAILAKNTAAIKKTEAADQWNYYQAKGNKQNLAELALALVPEDRKAQFQKDVERYKQEKAVIKQGADKLEAEVLEWDHRSEARMHEHDRWAQATTALQISIAMAAMALLTKRRWLAGTTVGLGGLGVVVGILAWLHI